MNLHGHLPLLSTAPLAMEMLWLLSTSGFLHLGPEPRVDSNYGPAC